MKRENLYATLISMFIVIEIAIVSLSLIKL
jgi:hypothetical protein